MSGYITILDKIFSDSVTWVNRVYPELSVPH
jgi:hypothetical protein